MVEQAFRAVDLVPITRFDPTVIPAEAILESELDDWWTLGRRVRVGQGFAANAAVLADARKLP